MHSKWECVHALHKLFANIMHIILSFYLSIRHREYVLLLEFVIWIISTLQLFHLSNYLYHHNLWLCCFTTAQCLWLYSLFKSLCIKHKNELSSVMYSNTNQNNIYLFLIIGGKNSSFLRFSAERVIIKNQFLGQGA